MDRIIRVTGESRISVHPDTIQLKITAEGISEEYGKAVKKSAIESDLIRNSISRAGLDPKDLKTILVNIEPEYEQYQDQQYNWKKKFIGYKHSHYMSVRFPNDNTILGRVFDELARCPVKVEFSIQYTVNDSEAAKNALLARAVSDSKEKAVILTEAAGVTLGDIVTIDYSWGELEIYSQPWNVMKHDVLECAGGSDFNFEASDINLQDTVTVVWEIK